MGSRSEAIWAFVLNSYPPNHTKNPIQVHIRFDRGYKRCNIFTLANMDDDYDKDKGATVFVWVQDDVEPAENPTVATRDVLQTLGVSSDAAVNVCSALVRDKPRFHDLRTRLENYYSRIVPT